jgi:hypothetical protein
MTGQNTTGDRAKTHTRPEAHGSEHWHTPAPLVAACVYGLTPPPGAPGLDLEPVSCAEANETVGAARWIGRGDP